MESKVKIQISVLLLNLLLPDLLVPHINNLPRTGLGALDGVLSCTKQQQNKSIHHKIKHELYLEKHRIVACVNRSAIQYDLPCLHQQLGFTGIYMQSGLLLFTLSKDTEKSTWGTSKL